MRRGWPPQRRLALKPVLAAALRPARQVRRTARRQTQSVCMVVQARRNSNVQCGGVVQRRPAASGLRARRSLQRRVGRPVCVAGGWKSVTRPAGQKPGCGLARGRLAASRREPERSDAGRPARARAARGGSQRLRVFADSPQPCEARVAGERTLHRQARQQRSPVAAAPARVARAACRAAACGAALAVCAPARAGAGFDSAALANWARRLVRGISESARPRDAAWCACGAPQRPRATATTPAA